MTLTIQSLFNEPAIVGAVINRVLRTRTDAIYWQEFLDWRKTTTRVFKDYIGSVRGVMAGSINSQFGEKPIRERRNMGSGVGEIAYLGDRYQMSVDRLSELQDLLDKYNEANATGQVSALNDIIAFIYDDYRQVMLAAHKRMDLVVGDLLMTGKAVVRNKDKAVSEQNATEFLNIELPMNAIELRDSDVINGTKKKLVTFLMNKLNELAPDFGKYSKMIMSRGTFVKHIIGSSEFGDMFKMQLGSNQMYLSTGLVTSDLASDLFTGIGLPAIEIKDDYVKEQNGKNVQVYADGHITLLPQDKIGYMRFHTPYEQTDPVPGMTYNPTGDGDMLVASNRDHNGRYLEYTAEWIPQIADPTLITTFDLTKLTK
ncbi:hypothetical protein ABVC73_05555 [Prevotella melaninogenica]